MGQALDSPDADGIARHAVAIKEDGYTAVGLYYFKSSGFKTLLTQMVAQTVSEAGLSLLSIYENGSPIKASYFSSTRGKTDANVAGKCAIAAGQPGDTPIYFAVDYDALAKDLPRITDYFTQVGQVLSDLTPQYSIGVYSSGFVCQHLLDSGLVRYTWLSQSTGFLGYDDWKPHADIVQGPSTTLFGLDVDLDGTNGHAGGWRLD